MKDERDTLWRNQAISRQEVRETNANNEEISNERKNNISHVKQHYRLHHAINDRP